MNHASRPQTETSSTHQKTGRKRTFPVLPLALALALTCLMPPQGFKSIAQPNLKTVPITFLIWPTTVDTRVTSGTFTRSLNQDRRIMVSGLPGETINAQLCCRATKNLSDMRFLASDIGDLVSGKYIRSTDVTFSVGRYLPVDETSKMTADPLISLERYPIPGLVSLPVWVKIPIPSDYPPGTYLGGIEAAAGAQAHYVEVIIKVLGRPEIEPPRQGIDVRFALSPEILATTHAVSPWSEPHLELIEATSRLLFERKIHSLAVPLHLVGPGNEMHQLIRASCPSSWDPKAPSFTLDFSRLDACLSAIEEGGITDSVLLEAVPDQDAVFNYRNQQTNSIEKLSLDPSGVDFDPWMEGIVPALREHLAATGKADLCTLAFPRAPQNEGEDGDSPKVIIRTSSRRDLASRMPEFFLHSPLSLSRRLPWTRIDAKAPLEAGYLNHWPLDIFQQPGGAASPSGSMFIVYPGPLGLLPSMRLETLSQGLEDARAIRFLRDEIDRQRKNGSADNTLRLAAIRKKLEKIVASVSSSSYPVVPIDAARRAINTLIREIQAL